ncbi:glucose N-acetyltransferase 1 [Ditylenchus destructor]|nr:glucose N-acetyltransferase 1 [Ditylenchus destructor]
MSSFLARFTNRFRYSYLHPDRNDVEREGGTQIKFHVMQLLTSKVVRAIGIISILLLVVIITFPQLPGANIYALRSYDSENSLTLSTVDGNGDLPTEATNALDWSRFAYVQSYESKIRLTPTVAGNGVLPTEASNALDWSRFAYVQYVTNTAYLCNSVMLFERLHSLGAKADKLMMYPSQFDVESGIEEARLIRKARDQYGVKLMPIQILQRRSGGRRRRRRDTTWAESYTKLLAFNQTQYDRVLSLDSDSTVLQAMDELFLAPSSPAAMPRAYWLGFDKRILSSQLVLIEPSTAEFERVMKAMRVGKSDDYDMDIVNNLYKDSALILPHRPYNLLTGEFRATNHTGYLGNSEEKWDPDAVLKEAKFLHFSDWPVPKPWLSARPDVIEKEKPKCEKDPATGQQNCRNRDIWLGFYSDFKRRRHDVCVLGLARRASTLDPGTFNTRTTPTSSKFA